MTNPESCPSTEQLKDLLAGDLTGSDQDTISRHVEDCGACQETLESLAGSSWEANARQLAGESKQETALYEVLQQAKGASQHETKSKDGSQDTEDLSFLSPTDNPNHLGRLDHYEILEIVGQGGMGVVLKAMDEKLQRIVAIKIMSPDMAAGATARRRFTREARAAAAVAHEHVVTIHAVEEDKRPPYLVMELVDGKSLQQRLDENGPLKVEEILRIASQTARGLASAHKQGLVHRDIKPANILLENGVERVKITDFGLARAADDASLTQSGVITGTPMFMSPEQAEGKNVDHRSDLFSLGSVMYAMCTGHPPFRAGGTMAVMKRVCEDSPRAIREINPEIPEWLCAIITKLHAKKPADRMQSAEESADLLERWLAHVQRPAENPQPAALIEEKPTAVAPAPKINRIPIYALGALDIAAGLIFMAVAAWGMFSPELHLAARENALYVWWTRITMIVGFGLAAALFAGGVGAVFQRTWARKWLMVLPIFALPYLVFNIPFVFTLVIPQQLLDGGVAFLVFGIVWLFFIGQLMFLKQPNVVEAFNRTSPKQEIELTPHRLLGLSWLVVLAAFALFILLPVLTIKFDSGYDKPVSLEFQSITTAVTVVYSIILGVILLRRVRRKILMELSLFMMLSASVYLIWFGPVFYRIVMGQSRLVLRTAHPENRYVVFRDGEILFDSGKKRYAQELTMDLPSGNLQVVLVRPTGGRISRCRSYTWTVEHLLWLTPFLGSNPITNEDGHSPVKITIRPGGECHIETHFANQEIPTERVRIRSTDPSFNAKLFRAIHGEFEVPVLDLDKRKAKKKDGAWEYRGTLHTGRYRMKIWQDGKLTTDESFALESGKPRLWEIDPSSRQQSIKLSKTMSRKPIMSPVQGADISPDGKWIASGHADGAIRLWSMATGKKDDKRFGQPFATGGVFDVAFSPNGEQLAWATRRGHCGKAILGAKKVTIGAFSKHDDTAILCLAFSPDGKHVIAGNDQGKLLLSEVNKGGQPIAVFDVPGGALVHDVDWSRSGNRIATGSADGQVTIWEVKNTGKKIELAIVHKLKAPNAKHAHTGSVYAVAFAPNGKELLTGGEDGKFRSWDVSTGKRGYAGNNNPRSAINAIAWSPDGSHWAMGSKDKTIQIFRADTVTNIQSLGEHDGGHTDDVTSLAFSRDGRYLISGSEDGTVKVWEFARPLAVPEPGTHPDNEKMLGIWEIVEAWDNGEKAPKDKTPTHLVITKEEVIQLNKGEEAEKYIYKIDPTRSPKWIDMSQKIEGPWKGIYELQGDTLRICTNDDVGGPRPDKFESRADSPNDVLFVCRRAGSSFPFIIAAKDGKAKQRFFTLEEALAASADSDVIEVCVDGPRSIKPVRIKDKSLTIRAGKGFTPLLYARHFPRVGTAFYVENKSLTLEGLHLRVADTGAALTGAGNGSLHLRNCSLFLLRPGVAVRVGNTPLCEIRNCQFVLPKDSVCIDWDPAFGKQNRLIVENNIFASYGTAIQCNRRTPDRPSGSLELKGNTFVVDKLFSLKLKDKPDQAAKTSKPLLIKAERNIFDTVGEVFAYELGFKRNGAALPRPDAEKLLAGLMRWSDESNLYPAKRNLILITQSGKTLNPPVTSLSSWNNLWKQTGTRCIQDQPKFGGFRHPRIDIQSALNGPTVGLLPTKQFRPKLGGPGAAFGADVKRIGPGEAYERELSKELQTQFRLLKRFTMKDRPFTRDNLTVEKDHWKIDTPTTNVGPDRSWRFFEINKPKIQGGILNYRVRFRSEMARADTSWLVRPQIRYRSSETKGEDMVRKGAIGPRGVCDWAWYDATLFLKPGEKVERIRLEVVDNAAGVLRIKDAELYHFPAAPKTWPSELQPTALARTFRPPPKTIFERNSSIAKFVAWKVEPNNKSWRIEAVVSSDGRSLPLWRIPYPNISGGEVVFRAKMKSENLRNGLAWLQLRLHYLDPSAKPVVADQKEEKLKGSTDWYPYEVRAPLRRDLPPKLIELNVVNNGHGKVWLKDVEVFIDSVAGNKDLPCGQGEVESSSCCGVNIKPLNR